MSEKESIGQQLKGILTAVAIIVVAFVLMPIIVSEGLITKSMIGWFGLVILSTIIIILIVGGKKRKN